MVEIIRESKTTLEKDMEDDMQEINKLKKELGESIKNTYKADKKKARAFIVKNILGDCIIKTGNKTESMYYYDNGVYKENANIIIKQEVQHALGGLATTNDVKEIIETIKRKTYFDEERLNLDQNTISTLNCIIHTENPTPIPHDPKYLSTIQIPVSYDPKVDCPKFKKFLSEILDQRDHAAIQELFGYCLWKTYKIQKAFMFIGGGHNGKSTLLSTLTAFLGQENISGASLQNIGMNRFALAGLKGKLANIYADIPNRGITNTGAFKMLTGGDPIVAEQKFKNPLPFFNHAKLIFSCNEVPASTDDTTAFYRRWVFINFPFEFPDNNPKCDPKLIDKITTPEELSGILNWALEGLERLRANLRFSDSKSTEEIRDQYIRLSNPPLAFLEDKTDDANPNVFITKDELYSEYIEYCAEKKLPTMANNQFAKKVKQYRPRVVEEQRRLVMGRKNCWVGLQLKENIKPGEAQQAPQEAAGTTQEPPRKDPTMILLYGIRELDEIFDEISWDMVWKKGEELGLDLVEINQGFYTLVRDGYVYRPTAKIIKLKK